MSIRPNTLLAAALAVAALAPAAFAATPFKVRIENVSTGSTLVSSTGMTAPAPNSPGMWVVHVKPGRLFEAGKPDKGWGMEAQAEDGNPMKLAEHCMHHEGVKSAGAFDTPVGDKEAGPALPGKAYEFTVVAEPGDRLSLVTMFGQSNDLFYAPAEKGIALFDKGRPVSGDVTSQLVLWDAGTEANEEPGFGPNQAPRQSAANTGPSEKKPVGAPKDGFKYPKVAEVLKVTITPNQSASQ